MGYEVKSSLHVIEPRIIRDGTCTLSVTDVCEISVEMCDLLNCIYTYLEILMFVCNLLHT